MESDKLFLKKHDSLPNAAIFLSGSGTNAEKVLEFWEKQNIKTWHPAVIITDRPKSSRAKEIAEKFNILYIQHGIKQFYTERGETRISIRTEKGRAIREEWTNKLREMISPLNIDFGIFAGFELLSNISSDFPCLNIHPGDLSVEIDSKRLLVGLHTIPIEIAIINGLDEMRSSVIIIQTYTGAGGEMDSGPLLGISTPVKIDLMNYDRTELIEIAEMRPKIRPIGGYKDSLEQVAKHNQELLKVDGDWIVFPQVIDNFAQNKYGFSGNQLFYMEKTTWNSINTVIYGKNIVKVV